MEVFHQPLTLVIAIICSLAEVFCVLHQGKRLCSLFFKVHLKANHPLSVCVCVCGGGGGGGGGGHATSCSITYNKSLCKINGNNNKGAGNYQRLFSGGFHKRY